MHSSTWVWFVMNRHGFEAPRLDITDIGFVYFLSPICEPRVAEVGMNHGDQPSAETSRARRRFLLQEVNDRVLDVGRQLAEPEIAVEFLCECGSAECAETVPLTPSEFEDVRDGVLRYFTAPGHQDGGTVIQSTGGFVVVADAPNPGRQGAS
jgi:hypothetical protein